MSDTHDGAMGECASCIWGLDAVLRAGELLCVTGAGTPNKEDIKSATEVKKLASHVMPKVYQRLAC